jgi:hypothetical protein
VAAGPKPSLAGGGTVRSLEAATSSITAQELSQYVNLLADPAFEGREAGSPAGQKAARWLAGELNQLGLAPAGSGGDYLQPFGEGYFNVLAFLPGSDPQLAGQVVLLGAHFDHVGYNRRRKRDSQQVYPGADDNASGVAGVLELAEAFCHYAPAVRRSVVFAFWDAEEIGLLGSKHWVQHPTLPQEQVVAAINLDMIGRLRQDNLHIVGSRSGLGWRRMFVLHNTSELTLSFSWALQPDSDHISFFDAGIPSVMLHTGLHEDYHRPTDTADRINYTGMQRVVQFAFALAFDLATRDQSPPYRPEAGEEKPPERKGDSIVRLGLEFRTDSPNGHPVEVARVLPGTPAENSGIRPGDQILRVAGREDLQPEQLRELVASTEGAITLALRRPGEEAVREVLVPLQGPPMPLGLELGWDPADPEVAVVVGVLPASPAALAGVQAGDRIWEVNQTPLKADPVGTFVQMVKSHRSLPSEALLTLLIERDGKLLRLAVPDPLRN